jgi:hypothetical protein
LELQSSETARRSISSQSGSLFPIFESIPIDRQLANVRLFVSRGWSADHVYRPEDAQIDRKLFVIIHGNPIGFLCNRPPVLVAAISGYPFRFHEHK